MDIFDAMDSETAALILQLQIEDTEELFSACEGKGKGVEGVLSDTQVALQIHKEELLRNANFLSDRLMTRSLTRACQTDETILAESFSQEQQAARDRRVALRLGGVAAPLAITGKASNEEELDNKMLQKLSALYICAAGDNQRSDSEDESRALVPYHRLSSLDDAESSKWATSRPSSSKIPKRHCTACQETFSSAELAQAPCTHEYCRTCLQDLFNASMTDDTLFPPRCCREPIDPSIAIRIYLTPSIIHRYSAKKIEFDTPNRTYCCNPLCSAFIRTEYVVEEKATCQVCRTVTCAICKGAEHGGDCPEDEALNLVLETARENQWQRCFKCHRLVELDTGCNHMTCPCGAQFCYKCGERWKTCRCEQWEEYRLYARAEVVADRQPAAATIPVEQLPEQRRARIATVVQDLLNRHECEHDSWRWVRGPHECEECLHDLPSYIFQCRQCHVQACNRCRRNRL